MLRKTLHWILLSLAIALWLFAAWKVREQERGRDPGHIAAAVAKDLARRVKLAEKLDEHKSELNSWIGDNAGSDFSAWLASQPYYLFAFQNDSLVAWNTTSVSPPQPGREAKLYRLSKGVYYGMPLQRVWLPKGASLLLLFQISQQYPFNNEYLQPRFLASDAIDPHVAVADTAVKGAAPLMLQDGRRIAWVHPPPRGDLPEQPGDAAVWCWLLSLVLLAIWAHSRISLLAPRVGWGWAALLLAAIAITARITLFITGPPFRIAETDLFSPRLYASSRFLPSLGDLLLHVLTAVWILLFITPRLHYRRINAAALRWLTSAVLCVGLFVTGQAFIAVVRSLVLDSNIPFDRQHLSSLEGSSLAGLLLISLLLSILLIMAGIVRNVLKMALPSVWAQFAIILLSALLVLGIWRADALLPVYGITILWLSIDVLGQLVTRLREGSGLFRVGNIFWSMAHCMLVALLLQHYTRLREAESRRHFAEHIATRHDDAMEYNFGQSFPAIQNDTALLNFFAHPASAARKRLDERLSSVYFNNAVSAYQARVYLYNSEGKPLFNRDTTSLQTIAAVTQASIPSQTTPDLFFREAATDDHIYLALAEVDDSMDRQVGTIAVDLEQKKIVAETVLPELLQPAAINQTEKAAGYSYAIYAGGRLVAQTNDYPFPFYVAHDTMRTPYHERKGNDFSTLIYSPDAYRSVYVWRRFNTLSEGLTLFSYLLLFRFLLLALGAAYRLENVWTAQLRDLFKNLRGIGLRRRLQLSIMVIVALSFAGIGIVTVIFLRQQYDNNGKTRRQAMMQVVSRAVQQWMKERDGDDNLSKWRVASQQPDFNYFLSSLALAQKIDINVFDADGHLTNTTQQTIYDQGLMAPLMRYSVLQEFANSPRSLITEIENIGRLRYQSCYVPLRTEGGEIAGFLNVPLFYAQRELEEQISSVVVTLINLYAAALLLSALLAYFITRWMTRAFDLIIRQFGRLNLHRNELVHWPYDDEIGVLVSEYNKMVRKVEESVAQLARSEREGAFREMARQVAHEIKNPLTPMNLYVQRLQRAIAAGEPDALQLAGRVSEALLEQINNLNVIATEFGEFAKIGSARPVNIELGEVVRNVVEPFAVDARNTVGYEVPDEPVHILADRSQLVRIITNLVKNATQAIPEDRHGKIDVRLSRSGEHALLTVTDNGTGIAPETQEKLFTPYFTTKSSGTGLGLAMTRQMVEAWGGAISFTTREGEGTSFVIRFPLLQKA